MDRELHDTTCEGNATYLSVDEADSVFKTFFIDIVEVVLVVYCEDSG